MPRFAGSLDANVVLRLLLNDIPQQHRKAKRLLASTTRQFAVADTAVIEVVFVLERFYRFSRPQIREVLEGFMSLSQVNCNRGMFDESLELFEASPSLSMEDCALAAYAKLNQALPLYTFDKKLASQAVAAELVR